MVKWLSGLFDTTDKEINRVRQIAAQANDEIEALLQTQRESIASLHQRIFAELSDAGGVDWQHIQAGEMSSVAAEARRLAGQAESLRAVIEKGEQTSRDLSVLLADSKQLAAMNADKLQR